VAPVPVGQGTLDWLCPASFTTERGACQTDSKAEERGEEPSTVALAGAIHGITVADGLAKFFKFFARQENRMAR
jgi:hypothetical protein